MTDFERDIVHAFNNYFDDETGVAYRDTQHQYADQKIDVLVDNPFIGIECKSKDASDGKAKLYFSRDFSSKQVNGVETHQVEAITDFLDKSGRKGFLALELRKGRGVPKQAYLVDWEYVLDQYRNDTKIEVSALETFTDTPDVFELERDENNDWIIPDEVFNRDNDIVQDVEYEWVIDDDLPAACLRETRTVAGMRTTRPIHFHSTSNKGATFFHVDDIDDDRTQPVSEELIAAVYLLHFKAGIEEDDPYKHRAQELAKQLPGHEKRFLNAFLEAYNVVIPFYRNQTLRNFVKYAKRESPPIDVLMPEHEE